ncbi:Dna Topoisomerase 3-Beta-1 [Manis pentadactyla]|nr:Dna Topoisomerase 3-Beta-1 [Manis pentadactyla]
MTPVSSLPCQKTPQESMCRSAVPAGLPSSALRAPPAEDSRHHGHSGLSLSSSLPLPGGRQDATSTGPSPLGPGCTARLPWFGSQFC